MYYTYDGPNASLDLSCMFWNVGVSIFYWVAGA